MPEDPISIEFVASLSYVYFTHEEDKSQLIAFRYLKRKVLYGCWWTYVLSY